MPSRVTKVVWWHRNSGRLQSSCVSWRTLRPPCTRLAAGTVEPGIGSVNSVVFDSEPD